MKQIILTSLLVMGSPLSLSAASEDETVNESLIGLNRLQTLEIRNQLIANNNGYLHPFLEAYASESNPLMTCVNGKSEKKKVCTSTTRKGKQLQFLVDLSDPDFPVVESKISMARCKYTETSAGIKLQLQSLSKNGVVLKSERSCEKPQNVGESGFFYICDDDSEFFLSTDFSAFNGMLCQPSFQQRALDAFRTARSMATEAYNQTTEFGARQVGHIKRLAKKLGSSIADRIGGDPAPDVPADEIDEVSEGAQ